MRCAVIGLEGGISYPNANGTLLTLVAGLLDVAQMKQGVAQMKQGSGCSSHAAATDKECECHMSIVLEAWNIGSSRAPNLR